MARKNCLLESLSGVFVMFLELSFVIFHQESPPAGIISWSGKSGMSSAVSYNTRTHMVSDIASSPTWSSRGVLCHWMEERGLGRMVHPIYNTSTTAKI